MSTVATSPPGANTPTAPEREAPRGDPSADIYAVIRTECARFAHLDAATVAERVMAAIGLPERWRPVMAPLVASACADRLRVQVRAIEAATFSPGPRPAPKGRPAVVVGKGAFEPDVKKLRALLNERFALGDGTAVTWGDATVAQHRARITILLSQEKGLVETRQRHDAAIDLIERAHTTTLRSALKKQRAA